MPWFQVDDQLGFHPKAIAAGNAAMGLWVRAGSWSMQQLTGGYVPAAIVRGLGTPAQAKKLVEVKLWVEADGGYQFHEWDERQMSKEDIEARRAKRAAAGRKGGQKSGITRRSGTKPGTKPGSEPVSDGEANAEANASAFARADAEAFAQAPVGASAQAGAKQAAKQTRTPVPVPVLSSGYVGGESLVPDAREKTEDPPPRRCPEHPDGPMHGCDPCLQAMDVRRSWTAERVVVETRPPDRCPDHTGFTVPPYCGGCRDARLAGEAWDREHAQRVATAKTLAQRRLAADRAKAIKDCADCDDDGYLGTSLCGHDPGRAERTAPLRADARIAACPACDADGHIADGTVCDHKPRRRVPAVPPPASSEEPTNA